jgi:hypothetical protein
MPKSLKFNEAEVRLEEDSVFIFEGKSHAEIGFPIHQARLVAEFILKITDPSVRPNAGKS